MFSSLEQLQEKFRRVVEFSPRARRTLGSNWVALRLTRDCGAITPPDKFGHFDLHESERFQGRDVIVDMGDMT